MEERSAVTAKAVESILRDMLNECITQIDFELRVI